MSKIRSFVLCIACLFATSASQGQIASWYKTYTGAIDKYAVTMHLHKAGHKYAGYYYYNSNEAPVYFSGEDTSTPAGRIRLSAFIPDEEADEFFTFSISGKVVTGEWNRGKNKPLPFSATETDAALAFDYIYTEGSILLRSAMKGSPVATFEAASIWPKGTLQQVTFLKKIITEEFDTKNSREDIGKIFLLQKKKFFADYINDNKELKDEDLKEAYSFNMDQSDQLLIAYQSLKLILLARTNYAYTGGAHGNYGTSYIPVNLISNKKIGINDIINKAGQPKLAKLLEKSFRKAYSLKAGDSLSEGGLFENKIDPNDNFYVTAKGIGFCYNPYEIGPYAMGEINVFIPFAELSAYLQPEFKKLIQ
jgi:hypothetical protein